jgi:putative DNA methylase
LPKRPIEFTFPITEVNSIAEKESTGFGRRHYRPWSVMHKWWARRLGSVFRTILLYSLADENMIQWNNNQNDYVSSKWDQNPHTLWNFYSHDVKFPGKIVLDPMMGGGTTVVEALRLGCKVIAGDLNPVAWFVVKKQIENIDPQQLKAALTSLDKKIGDDLRKYYKTICPECGNEAEALYYFYYKEMKCSDCGLIIPLMRDFFLAKSPVGNGDVVICPDCWHVFTTNSAEIQVKCTRCGTKFNPKQTYYFKQQKFQCPNKDCTPKKIVKSIMENGRPNEKMYAIEFYCKTCDETGNSRLKHGRGYKAADSFDKKLLEKAKKEFKHIGKYLPIPNTSIPQGVETKRALNHGYRKFRDLFNRRQLLILGKIYKWILELKDWNVKEFFTLAFSNCLKYNNMFCKYNSTRGFITDIFRTHSYSPSMAPVESNCYDAPKGRGSFTAFVNLVIEGKEYCRNPFERIIEGDTQRKFQFRTPIIGNLVKNYTDLIQNGNVFLQCGSSEQLDIPDKSVDVIVTDPPYYGNVMYSELSNFFYAWLRLALQEKYPQFKPELVPWKSEIIENRAQKKGKSEFLEKLGLVFVESRRVLKDEGILTFTFHHRSTKAWSLILQAVLNSGFYISATYPVRSEMEASTHLYSMENIKYDVILICRKRNENPPNRKWSLVLEKIDTSSRKMISRLRKNGEIPKKLDIFVIVLGKCLEQYSKYYPNVSERGKAVNIGEALSSIEEIISNLTE